MKKLKQTIKLAKKQALVCLALGCLLIVAAFSVQVAQADWQEPTAAPPGGNIPAPLTVGAENQAKEGKLLLDPNYNPDYPPSSFDNPLEVVGSGAKIIEVTTDDLQAADTLYVDKVNHQVGIGTPAPSAKLTVLNGTVMVGTSTNPISTRAVSATSSNDYGISGTVSASDAAGIYGLTSSAAGYGIYGRSNSKYGIYGQSTGGYGIYGVTNNSGSYAAVFGENTATGWAGYFDGLLGAGGDVVSSRFLSTDLRTSLLPFTSGQEVAAYDYGIWDDEIPTFSRVAFDGTYVWVATNRDDTSPTRQTLFKVRASDGIYIKSYRLGWYESALTFDGKYLWILSDDNDLHRLDPTTDDITTISAADLGLTNGDESRYMTVSTINGQIYVWVIDNDDNRIVRINTSNLSPPFDDYDLTSNTLILGNPGISSPEGITFDGQYIWIAARGSGHLVRLWAEDPNNPPNPNIAFDTTTALLDCNPVSVVFDGVNIWCTPDGGTNQLVRVWPDDPNDPQHPAQGFGSIAGWVKGATTDGTYLWAAELQTGRLYRFLLADPTQETFFETTVNQPESLAFDGTYIWTADEMINQPQLHKFYSGTGLGHTDLNTVVNLRTRVGQCENPDDPPSSSLNQCVFDWQCPYRIGAPFGVGGVINGPEDSWDAKAIAIDSEYMYVVGADDTNGYPDINWRIEKRQLSDASLDTSFDGDGIVVGASDSEVANEIAIDSTYMYVVGHDDAGNTWRIEKRLLSSGQLCAAGVCDAEGFGDDPGGGRTGIVQHSDGIAPQAIAIDTANDFMYIIGNDGSASSWRIEKRDLTTGDYVAGFGGASPLPEGVVEGDNITDSGLSIAINSSSMYVTGDDNNTNDRIEKRDLATGDYDTVFGGGSGAVTGTGAVPYDIAIDSNYMYVVGFPTMLKRDLITGELCAAGVCDAEGFGDDPGSGRTGTIDTGSAVFNALAIDSTYMYVVGDTNISPVNWQIEKRFLTTGDLETTFGGFGIDPPGVIIDEDMTYEAEDIAIDSTNNYMYVVGSNGSGSYSDHNSRLERRLLSTGALEGGSGSSSETEICNVDNTTQSGNINVAGLAELNIDHCYDPNTFEHFYDRSCTSDADCSGSQQCVGGDLRVVGNTDVLGNTWQVGTEVTVGVAGDPKTAECPAGTFIKGIIIDAAGKLDNGSVICQGL